MVEVKLFGGFQVMFDGKPMRGLRSASARALLAYLCVEHSRPHLRESLATLLRPSGSDKEARHGFRTTLSRLRRALKSVLPDQIDQLLLVGRKNVEWQHNATLVRVDSFLFEQTIENLEAATILEMEAVVALYSADLLKGFHIGSADAFDDWLLIQREQTQRQMMQLLTALGEKAVAAQQWDSAIKAAQRQLELEAWHEAAFQRWMVATARQGRRADALALYDRCCDVLADELGVSPSDATFQLFEQIRDGDIGPVVSPSQRYVETPATPRHNLPVALTLMVNRTEEAASLAKLLQSAETRWVTLVGEGGVGKSRLSTEVGQRLLTHYPDGVWFIPLARLQAGDNVREEIATLIASEMGVSLQGKTSAEMQLLNSLRNKHALLIFDNFEHVYDAAEIVPTLLRAAPELRVLCTSRVPLEFIAEKVCPLGGLIVPDSAEFDVIESHPVLQLFDDRARNSSAWFEVTADNVDDILAICRFVGGNPLGIELAASGVRHRAPAEILARLQASYRQLKTRMRDIPQRHRSMLTVLNDSWDLLEEEDQAVLAQLSVFRGGFSAEAALAVVNADEEMLEFLIDRSLLQRLGDERFGMHEVLRQFSAEKLTTPAPTFHSHSVYYLNFLSEREDALQRDQPLIPAEEIDLELDNVRQAWRTGRTTINAGAILTALHGLSNYFQLRGRSQEAERLFADVVASFEPHVDTDVQAGQIVARGLVERGRYLNRLTRCPEAFESAQAALPLADQFEDEWAHDMGRIISAEALWRQSQYDAAKDQLEKTHAHKKPQQNAVAAWYHHHMGSVLSHKNQYALAIDNYRSAILIWKKGEQKARESVTLNSLSQTFQFMGDMGAAAPYVLASIKIQENLSDNVNLAWNWINLGNVFLNQGELLQAREAYNQAIMIARISSSNEVMGLATMNLGTLANSNEDLPLAASLFAKAIKIQRRIQNDHYLSRSLYNLGHVTMKLGNLDHAIGFYKEAYDLSTGLNDYLVISKSLLEMAIVRHKQGNIESAMALANDAMMAAKRMPTTTVAQECMTFMTMLKPFMLEKSQLASN